MGSGDPEVQRKTFDQSALALKATFKPEFKLENSKLSDLDDALNRFDQASPLVKRQIVHACAKAVVTDEKITSEEAELLRAVADTIGCPIPPFVRQEARAA